MEPALKRQEHAIRVASGVLGVGMAALGVAALFEGLPVGWGVATLVLSLGAFWCAASPARGLVTRVMPFVVGGALVLLAGLGFAGALRAWFVISAIGLGAITLVVGTLAEYPEFLGGPRPPHRREVAP